MGRHKFIFKDKLRPERLIRDELHFAYRNVRARYMSHRVLCARKLVLPRYGFQFLRADEMILYNLLTRLLCDPIVLRE